jgi:hypothetical protein
MLKTYTTIYRTKTYTANIEQQKLTWLSRYCHLNYHMGHIPYGETPPSDSDNCYHLVGEKL